jgi:spermidine/putrescine transport system ATP-binding protein
VPAYRRPVNTVFQNYALFPHLSVFDNVGFGLRERGVSRKEAEPQIREMLSLVRLDGRESARPNELSGGQQQRVGLARALIMKPKVLLLDEPLGALDLKLRRQMQALLKQVHAEVGIAFVYVTHDQEEAFSMSDRVAVVSDGRVEQVGEPQELYQRPATRFVAGFVGSANQLEGDVVARPDSSRVRVRLRGLATEVTCGAPHGISVGDAVVAIARPEVTELVAPDHAGERTVGQVTDVSYLGPHAVYTLRTAAGMTIEAMRQGWEPVAFQPGDSAAVLWPPDQCWAVHL